MTHRELYLLARQRLQRAGVDSPGVDAALLAERFLGLDRRGLALHGEETPPPEKEELFLAALAQREARRPLQYILGKWEFLGMELSLGEGVLVPREDTIVLVETLAKRLEGIPAPRGIDLCAGTGAVALGLLTQVPECFVQCVEVSQKALPYLEENLRRYGNNRVTSFPGDMLSRKTAGAFVPGSLDFLCSNPPYIATGELSALQPEVRREPALALDGGPDGLVFYRALVELWLPLVRQGGVVAVEIGETQGSQVEELFAKAGLEDVKVTQDWSGLDRVVSASVGLDHRRPSAVDRDGPCPDGAIGP